MPCSATVVVPCYNEACRLDSTAFLEYAKTHAELSFLFVDDGSTDNTATVLEKLVSQRPKQLAVLCLPENVGKAESVRTGILAALEKSDYVGFLDADLATPLLELDRFLEIFREDNHLSLVMGSRIKRLGAEIDRARYRHYIGRGVATLISTMLSIPIYDSQCGAKLFRRQLAEEIFAESFVSTWLFDVELLARIIARYGRLQAKKMVYELPLEYWRDVGDSKVRFSFACRIPLELLKIRRRWL